MKLAGVVIIVCFNKGEAVDAGDNVSGIFAESVKDDLKRSLANLVCGFCNSDCTFGSGKTFVACEKCKALCVFVQQHCTEIAVAEADFALVRNRTGDTERLKTLSDVLCGFGCIFCACLDCDRSTDGVCPNCIFKSNGLNSEHD